MNSHTLNEIVTALNRKNVSQPCPRCASKNFSVVGESEISVVQPSQQAIPTRGLLGFGMAYPPTRTTMPTVIITCDNCGYISQHAKAALGLFPPPSALGMMGRGLK